MQDNSWIDPSSIEILSDVAAQCMTLDGDRFEPEEMKWLAMKSVENPNKTIYLMCVKMQNTWYPNAVYKRIERESGFDFVAYDPELNERVHEIFAAIPDKSLLYDARRTYFH